jgi:Protein of unknown function (DUF1698)
MEILEKYVKTTPNPQNSLDIFEGEWASKLPEVLSNFSAGQIPLFQDARITWAATHLGGFTGQKVLELGPLEAGHTYMMEQLGAASITAVEANSRAYLKCLIIKEILGLQRSKFLLGDAIEYLKQHADQFDICVASGVLYHMENPAELIHLISQAANRVFIWTHYYDKTIIDQKSYLASRFSAGIPVNYQGFCHTTYRQEYGEALGFAGFCGGSRPFSSWMKREDVLSCLDFFGFSDISIAFDSPDHANGPCFAIAASRT